MANVAPPDALSETKAEAGSMIARGVVHDLKVR
jgi:hypothetical protein